MCPQVSDKLREYLQQLRTMRNEIMK